MLDVVLCPMWKRKSAELDWKITMPHSAYIRNVTVPYIEYILITHIINNIITQTEIINHDMNRMLIYSFPCPNVSMIWNGPLTLHKLNSKKDDCWSPKFLTLVCVLVCFEYVLCLSLFSDCTEYPWLYIYVVNSRSPSLCSESMSFNLPQCASANSTSFNLFPKLNPSTPNTSKLTSNIHRHASSWPSALHIAPLSHYSVQLHWPTWQSAVISPCNVALILKERYHYRISQSSQVKKRL